MRVIITKKTVYKFEELSDNQKDLVIERHGDINVGYEWWDCVYTDAEDVGIKITSFDDYNITGELLEDAFVVATNIIKSHGDMCETFSTVENFIENYLPWEDMTGEEQEAYEEDGIEGDFLQEILEDYRVMLRREFEYLTSDEAITETLVANDYEFTAEGELV